MIINNLKNKNYFSFNKIGEISLNINIIDNKLGIQYVIDNYHLDSFEIINDKNNFRTNQYFLKKDEFYIQYTVDRKCELCLYNICLKEFFISYISFNFDYLIIIDKIKFNFQGYFIIFS